MYLKLNFLKKLFEKLKPRLAKKKKKKPHEFMSQACEVPFIKLTSWCNDTSLKKLNYSSKETLKLNNDFFFPLFNRTSIWLGARD